ncbi:hypothetical protein COEX109129_07230 [Corallococcus exiguus]
MARARKSRAAVYAAMPSSANSSTEPLRVTARARLADAWNSPYRLVSSARSSSSISSTVARMVRMAAKPLSSFTTAMACRPSPRSCRSTVSCSSASFSVTAPSSRSNRCCCTALSAMSPRSSASCSGSVFFARE